jgi:hypothetical protein
MPSTPPTKKADSFSPIAKDEIPSGPDNNIQILNPKREILNKTKATNTNAQNV